jgi:amino acid adenylation domain-containing protein
MPHDERPLNERLSSLSPAQLKALLQKGREGQPTRPGKPARMERNSSGTYPLSKAQERMWFLNTLSEGEAIYNNPAALRIKAEFHLNIATLTESLGRLATRHEILRTTFSVEDGVPVQVIHPEGKPEIIYEDFRPMPTAEREKRAMEEAILHGKIFIPLDRLPLLRFKVLHLQDTEYMLLINPHHIISDGWSNALFAKELSMTYAALEGGEPVPFTAPEYQYVDFVRWEKEWLESPACADQLRFWKEQLSDLPEPLRLPLDFPRPPVMSYRGSKEFSEVSVAESDRLRQFCQQNNITLFHLLFGAFSLLMSKYSGQDDLLVGMPVARRNQLWFQNTMGLFINTVPLRVKTDDGMTAIDFLRHIKAYSQQALTRQELPFEKLIEEVNPNRNLSTNPVFQVHFVHQNIPSLYSVKGLSVKPEGIDYSWSKFDLNFWVEEANQGLVFSVTYPTDIFLPSTVKKLIGNYRILLNSIISHPEQTCGVLEYSDPSDRSVAIGMKKDYNSYAGDGKDAWLESFATQVRSVPGNIAVRDPSRKLSYAMLDHESQILSSALANAGVVKSDLVGILIPRGVDLIVSILAVFRCGAAYVPLDPAWPPERLDFIATDAGIRLIIKPGELQAVSPGSRQGNPPNSLAKMNLAVLDSPTTGENLSAVPIHLNPADVPSTRDHADTIRPQAVSTGSSPEDSQARPEDLAYVIYTSGTTGVPKGVCVGRNQLFNYSKAVWERMGLEPGASCATITSIAADLGNTSIFPPLIHGATVVVIPEEYATDASMLAGWLTREPIDCLKIVPSHLLSLLHSMKASAILPGKLLVTGGEKCTPVLARKVRELSPQLRIINHYGPTESTVGSLTWELPAGLNPAPGRGRESYPIGFPLANTRTYIISSRESTLLHQRFPNENGSVDMAAKGLHPLPKGVTGEIVLAGANIAAGYLNRPELTRENFAPDPYCEGESIYFTGDLGRMDDDGAVTCLGRKDHQLKVRGYRVEPGEVEQAMTSFPGISQAAVILPEETSPVDTLRAVICLAQGATYEEAGFRQWLARQLPSYMLPSEILRTDHIPVTVNGKTDMKKLRALFDEGKGEHRPGTAPRDLVELKLITLYNLILGRGNTTIEDSFFDLGGHSLLAIRLFSEIEKEFGIHLPLATLFKRSSVQALAEAIRSKGVQENQSALVAMRPGKAKPSLYLVHPAGGNVLCYFELGKELPGEFSVFGLQASGLYGKEVRTVGDMAAIYLKEVDLSGQAEDLCFAGWSMGALIAFEMARQVKEIKGEAPRLVIIDQLAPSAKGVEGTRGQVDPVDRMVAFAGKVAHLVGRPLGIGKADLRSKSPIQRSEVFLEAFKKVNLVPGDMPVSHFHGYLDTMIMHNEITAECRPGIYEGPTLLIRALDTLPLISVKVTEQEHMAGPCALPVGAGKVTDQEGTAGPDTLPVGAAKVTDQGRTADLDPLPPVTRLVTGQERTADLGWGAYIPHGLTIRNIPGNHVSVMARPWVKELARSLAEWSGITEKNQPE